jgi:serine/threonine protein kinase
MLTLVTPLPEGHRLSEYRIISVLGQGGFGTTYLCRDENLQNECVLKEFTPPSLATRTADGALRPTKSALRDEFNNARDEFVSEARKLAQFNHPNIVRVNRYFEAHNTGYFVMAFESGASLRSMIRTGVGLTEETILSLVGPLCQGLARMHKSGLIHRDIKPDNIIVRPDGTPALIDFGAAANFRNVNAHGFELIASRNYAPVEQFNAMACQGPWTDIYALGAVMYEMISGNPPVPSLERGRGKAMRAASDVGRGSYSDRLLELIDKCLSMNFVERPRSTEEVGVILEAADDQLLRSAIHDISFKMVCHFTNWAKPNEGLNCGELIAFVVCFPIVDLSWRIGQGIPDKATFNRLYKLMGNDPVQECRDLLIQKGFHSPLGELQVALVRSRLDEYAATYLLDRQESEWRYGLTCTLVAQHCIADSHVDDVPEFMALMEDVIDRARGRVKKEYRKAFRSITWRKTPDGWTQMSVGPQVIGEE